MGALLISALRSGFLMGAARVGRVQGVLICRLERYISKFAPATPRSEHKTPQETCTYS